MFSSRSSAFEDLESLSYAVSNFCKWSCQSFSNDLVVSNELVSTRNSLLGFSISSKKSLTRCACAKSTSRGIARVQRYITIRGLPNSLHIRYATRNSSSVPDRYSFCVCGSFAPLGVPKRCHKIPTKISHEVGL